MACCSRCCESAADGQAEVLQNEIWYVQLQLMDSGMHESRNSLVHCVVKRVKVSQQWCERCSACCRPGAGDDWLIAASDATGHQQAAADAPVRF